MLKYLVNLKCYTLLIGSIIVTAVTRAEMYYGWHSYVYFSISIHNWKVAINDSCNRSLKYFNSSVIFLSYILHKNTYLGMKQKISKSEVATATSEMFIQK